MSQPDSWTTGAAGPSADSGAESVEVSTGDLVARLSSDVSRLVRDELRLAQVELSSKARQAGIGAGMFGAAGVLALYGGAALAATAILALDLALPAWASALVVTALLFAAAGVAALLGKQRVGEATPPIPDRTVESVKQDVDAVRHPHEHRPAARHQETPR